MKCPFPTKKIFVGSVNVHLYHHQQLLLILQVCKIIYPCEPPGSENTVAKCAVGGSGNLVCL